MDLRELTEAAEILADRRDQDGLMDFDPFVHQTKLAQSTKSEAWLFGGNRSGKTEELAAIVATYARHGVLDHTRVATGATIPTFKPVKIWCISLTYDMSRNIMQPKIFDNGAGLQERKPFIPASEIASWNITNQTLKLNNGSLILFKSCDGGRNVFQGADVELVAFDEVPNEEVYKEVAMRVGGGRRLLVRGAATILPPPGVPGGVSWMFSRKVRPWLDAGGNDDSEHLDIFTASIYDNTTILDEELRRMESQYPPGSQEHRIRMKGELLPTIGGTLVYPPFNRTYHTNKELIDMRTGQPTARIIHHQPLCLSLDFNVTDGVWLVGQYMNGRFLALDEIAMERSDIASMTYEFRSRFPSHSAELWVYGDATGRRRNEQTGESNYHLFQQYMTGYPVPIRFHIPDVNPAVADRINAVNLALRPPDGSKKVEISPLCENLIADAEAAKWKANGKIDKLGGRRQDAMDCFGYWIYMVAPVARFGRVRPGLRSIPSPNYGAKRGARGPFPASRSIRPRKVGNRYVVGMR